MKLTPAHIESQIATTRYISQESLTGLGTLTLCVLDMKNGTKVVGQSACLDVGTFDAEIGKELARKDAVNKVWELEGYASASVRASKINEGRIASILLEAGWVSAELAVHIRNAAAQAYQAGYEAHANEGQP